MRIGIFVYNYLKDSGGVRVSIDNIIRELNDNNHEVYVITNNIDKTSNDFYDEKILKLKKVSLYDKKVFTKLDSLNLDIIEHHSGLDLRLTAKRYSKKRKKPLIQVYFRNYYEYIVDNYGLLIGLLAKYPVRLLTKYLCNSADRVICNSDNMYRLLNDEYDINKNIDIVEGAIRLKEYQKKDKEKREEIMKSLGIYDIDFVLLVLGAVRKEKRIEEIISILPNLRDCIKLKLLIVGDGEEVTYLKKLTEDLGVHNVIFVGKVPHDEVPHYYHFSDVLVVNSRYGNQGITIMEALSASLPVVCYENKVYVDYIRNNQNGVIYNNKEELEQILRKLYEKPMQLEIMKEYAKLSSTKFSNEYVLQRLERIYKDEVKRRKYDNFK